MLLSNRTVDGQLLGPGDPMADILRGNEGWHTDSSFKRVSAKASILSAREVPADGGETEWADMRAGYQALEPAVRTKIENLAAYHSLLRSQARIGAAESERLLEDLVHFACQGPRVLQHRWQAGDVVIWDNRCVLHRVRPWNLSEGRVMVHTRVAGDPITELAS